MTLTPANELNIGISDDEAVLLVDGQPLPSDEPVTIPAGDLAAWIVGVVRLAIDTAERPKVVH